MYLPRRRTVTRSAMSSTSLSLWVMKMTDVPCAVRLRRMADQLGRLLGRQDGGRLVQDQDLGAPVERLQDLDALLHADRDVLDERVRVHRQPERSEMCLTRAAASTRSSEHPSWWARPPSTMFSATVMTGMSMKCWCTIPIPSAIASRGEAISTRPAVHEDLALVRGGEPVEDVHERRLAGAVLAEQGVHLAAPEVELDVVGGDDPGVPLRDAAQLQHGLPRRSRRRRRTCAEAVELLTTRSVGSLTASGR